MVFQLLGHALHLSKAGSNLPLSVTGLDPSLATEIAYAQIHRTHEFGGPLGTEFEPGQTISVTVNDLAASLTAQ